MSVEDFGIFETVRVENGKAVLPELHYDRLSRSSKALAIPLNISFEEFTSEVEKHACFSICLVRLTLYRNGNYGFSCRKCEFKEPISLMPFYGIKRCYSDLSMHKTADIMSSLYALEKAKDKGFDDVLLFDSNGFISETAFANIFIVRNGIFLTPSLKTGCLQGTRRKLLIELLRDKGFNVIEGFFTLNDALSSDEVLVTSTRYDVTSISRIGGEKLPAYGLFSGKLRRLIRNYHHLRPKPLP
jgi:branched-chain amino acid aminotransferase